MSAPVPFVVHSITTRPCTTRDRISFGLFPRSKPGMRAQSRSPASTAPGTSAAFSRASSGVAASVTGQLDDPSTALNDVFNLFETEQPKTKLAKRRQTTLILPKANTRTDANKPTFLDSIFGGIVEKKPRKKRKPLFGF